MTTTRRDAMCANDNADDNQCDARNGADGKPMRVATTTMTGHRWHNCARATRHNNGDDGETTGAATTAIRFYSIYLFYLAAYCTRMIIWLSTF